MEPARRTTRVAVYTLLMRDEFEAARVSLSSIARGLGATTRLFVLLNDRQDADIRGYFEAKPNVTFLCTGSNRGVAGGRNVLLRACLDWNADVLVSYDPDLMPPRDYLRSMVEALQTLSRSEPVGVIAAAVVDANACRELWEDDYARVRAAIARGGGGETFCFDPAVGRRWLIEHLPRRGAEVLYHLGIRGWRRHYLGTSRHPSPPTFLSRDAAIQRCVIDATGPVPVDTLPGGLHCYGASLARKLGGFDDAFSPFGYEDADFCIRALRAGYRNYLVPSVVVIHDICRRNEQRDLVLLFGIRGKSQRLLGRKHLGTLAGVVNRCRLLVVESSRIVRGRRFQALRVRAGGRSRWLLRAYVGGLLGLADPHRIARSARARLTRPAVSLTPRRQSRPRPPRGGLKRFYWRLPPSIRTVLGRVVFSVVSSRPRPLVSVVVVRSGGDRGLAECLQSVCDQQYRHIECLVVDDGSGDSSGHVLDAVAGDSRFRVIDGNGARTRAERSNIGLHAAEGELVTFLAPGERLTPTSIWSRLVLYRFKDDGLLAGVACARRTPGVRRPARRRRSVEWIDFLTPPRDFPVSVRTILAGTRTLRGVGGFDANLGDGAFDPDLWVRVLRQGMVLYTTGEYGVEAAPAVRGEPSAAGDSLEHGEFTARLEAPPGRQRTGAAGGPRLSESPGRYRRMVAEARESYRRAAACHVQRDTAGFEAAVASLDPGLSGILARHVDLDREIEQVVGRHRGARTSRREIRHMILARADAPSPRRATRVAVREQCTLFAPDADKLRRFKDRHQGGRCFIIGNGPSLNRHDLDCLRGEITFGVNGIFYKTDETGFRPTYYVVEDSHVVADNLPRINAFEVEQKFFPADYRDMIDGGDNVAFFRMNKGFYEPASPTYRTPMFSFDAAERLYCGQSVTYINLQLAFYMGFTEVYLIGMDFSYAIPAGAIIDGMTITSTDDDPNHFHPDYFGKGKKWHDPQLDQVRRCYEHAKNVFEEHGRRIYNASKGGKLEVFPRVEYDALLEACAGL